MAEPFSGEPHLVWVTDPKKPDRDMTLVDEFWFEDGPRRWTAPAKMKTDGASIPRPLWTLVGSPFTGDYRRAALVHDKACKDAQHDTHLRRAADRMFYRACRSGGCSKRDAMILYVGVRIGAILPNVATWASVEDDDRPRLSRSPGDERVERAFVSAADQVLASGETDNDEEVERRTDLALARVTGIPLIGL